MIPILIGAAIIGAGIALSSDDKKDAAKLNPGDVIYVERLFKKVVPYQHFGIYSGDNNVIHYFHKTETVEETDLETFLEDKRELFICNFNEHGYKESVSRYRTPLAAFGMALSPALNWHNTNEAYRKLYSPEETINRARSCIGKGEYDVVTHNCEHFALWCKTGVSESEQIEVLIKIIIGISIGFKLPKVLPA